jgi:serine/threonine protein phosphatase PrpC
MDSQFCEDNIIEQSIGSNGLIVGVFDGHGGHKCSRVASARLVSSIAQLMAPANDLKEDTLSASSSLMQPLSPMRTYWRLPLGSHGIRQSER